VKTPLPSSLTLAGFYTDTESWAGVLGTETYFKDDKYRAAGWFGHYDVNLELFAIGSGAGDRGESPLVSLILPFSIDSPPDRPRITSRPLSILSVQREGVIP
jgi:hypothetical protein